jgi:phenylpropionate dioxygenase-like ring-hydroxylating dioxygenase large terminal subunit
MKWGRDEISALVKGNRVDRRLYTDAEIFDLELDRIFGRAWIYVAHESQLKTPGSFVRARLGRYEVVVTRHKDREIYVLHNRCAHRGARFLTGERGTSLSFVCPYHGWSFSTDGSLEGVPHRKSYPATFGLDDPCHQLMRAPRVESYRGFVFASLAPSGPSLREHLGQITSAFDNLIDRSPDGEIEICETGFRTEFRANWKMHQENGSDIFHPGFVHESSVLAARRSPTEGSALDDDLTRVQLRSNDRGPGDWENAVLVGLPEGHSYRSGFYRSGVLAPGAENPAQTKYRAALVERYGEERTAEILGVDRFNNLVFPNILLNAQYHQLRVVHPIAADRTLMISYCFRLKGAPEEIFHRAVRYLTNLNSPASMISSDDIDIFERCQAGLREGGSDWVDFSRGFGQDVPGPDDTTIAHASELPMRFLHSAWLAHMVQDVT